MDKDTKQSDVKEIGLTLDMMIFLLSLEKLEFWVRTTDIELLDTRNSYIGTQKSYSSGLHSALPKPNMTIKTGHLQLFDSDLLIRVISNSPLPDRWIPFKCFLAWCRKAGFWNMEYI